MGKRTRGRRRVRRQVVEPAGEDRRSVAVTVAWMLSLLATLMAGVVALAAFALLRFSDTSAYPAMLRILPRLMLLTATVTGSACLLLTLLTYRFRQFPPPPVITAVAVCVGAAPLLVVMLLLVTQWSQS